MRKLLVLLGLCALSFAALDYNVDVVSRAIWRGQDFGDPVVLDNNDKGELWNNTPALQPGISYTFDDLGLSLGLWASVGLGDHSTQELDEFDYTAGYSFSAGGIDFAIGYTHYTFPSLLKDAIEANDDLDDDDDAKTTVAKLKEANESDEISLGLTFSELFLSPSLTFYYDYDGNAEDTSKYLYTELGLSLPAFAEGWDHSLTFGIDGTPKATGLTNIAYGLSTDLGYGFSAYGNLVYVTGAYSGTGVIGGKDEKGKYNPINEDSYEIVFGVSYSGSVL
jgi:hypothetical protein